MPSREQTDSTRVAAVLYPAVAYAARQMGNAEVGLVGLGEQAELNLEVDRAQIRYSNGQAFGGPDSTVQVSCRLVGANGVPETEMPEVVARVVIERDPIDLPNAIAQVAPDALPIVVTTWSVSRIPTERRWNLIHRLQDEASSRPIAWVSVEGIGVVPVVPTLGDRRASGHSIIGLVLMDRASLRAYALGRCWSRGRALEWLA